MAVDFEGSRRFRGDELDPGAPLQRQIDVLFNAVHERGDGALGHLPIEGGGDL